MSEFRVTMMFHPSLRVPDLVETQEFYEKVFGRTSTRMQDMMRTAPVRPGYPTDYCVFTPIRDVFFDAIDPKKYLMGGEQFYPDVNEPHLNGFGWYVEGSVEGFHKLKEAGIALIDQFEKPADGDEPPGSPQMPMYFTAREAAGLRYQFFPPIPMPVDPRTAEDWVLPPVAEDDPLALDYCSHHTVLTSQPERALKLVVDVLGGTVIHEGRDELRNATSTYVHLADGVLEYAVPDSGTVEHEDWTTNAPNDTYHAITWKVADLERAERHLSDQGVKIRTRSDDTLITDPKTSLGIPWGFSTKSVPGDPRVA